MNDSSKENLIEDPKRTKVAKVKAVKDPTKKRVRRERAKPKPRTDKVFKKHLKTTSAEIREDPDLEKEIEMLARNGLKNQKQTLQLSRLCGKSCADNRLHTFGSIWRCSTKNHNSFFHYLFCLQCVPSC